MAVDQPRKYRVRREIDHLRRIRHGDAPPDGLIAYEWRTGKAWKIVVVNLSGGTCQGRIPLAGSVDAKAQYTFWDQLHDVKYPRSGEELSGVGLFVRRDAFEAHLFDITAAS